MQKNETEVFLNPTNFAINQNTASLVGLMHMTFSGKHGKVKHLLKNNEDALRSFKELITLNCNPDNPLPNLNNAVNNRIINAIQIINFNPGYLSAKI